MPVFRFQLDRSLGGKQIQLHVRKSDRSGPVGLATEAILVRCEVGHRAV